LNKIHDPQQIQNTGPDVFIRNSPVPGFSGFISTYRDPAVISRKLPMVKKRNTNLTLDAFGSGKEKPLIS